MIDPVIRALGFEDLDDALRLSTIVGWNQRPEDWRMLLRLAPASAFAAVIDARIVGTAMAIDYGGFAWITMMLVDPAYRRRGVGRRLLEAAMDAMPPNLPVRLDATPLGRPLYQQYGFEDEATLSRYVSDVQPPSLSETSVPARDLRPPQVPPSQTGGTEVAGRDGGCSLRPLTASDLERVIERDHAAFGGTRAAVLAWAFHCAPQYAHIMRSPDGLTHYCFGRPGRLFDQIGPVVAANDDIAKALLSAALSAAGDRPVVVDAFAARTAFATWLRSHGFAIQRPLVRMCRPAKPGARAVAVRESSLEEFAIFGPEFA